MSTRSGMVVAMLGPFVLATRECAMQMLSNASYVLGELPNVKMSDGLCERTRDDLEFGSASVLVMESAGNILQAYEPMQTAADAVLRAVRGVPLQGASPS